MNLRYFPEVFFGIILDKTRLKKTSNNQKIQKMKKLTSILMIATALFLGACEGPVGPPGMDGDSFIGTVFEVQGDFTPENNYLIYDTYPSNVVVYDTDVVLVYILWEDANGMDVWRLMPQTVVLPEGVIQYNFDYTYADFQIFLEFTIPADQLLPAETDNQIFRVVVLPADFAAKKEVDINDFNSVIGNPELQLSIVNLIQPDNTLVE